MLTGLSGSGKSTLAFDTIYAEGQRRYVESLSAYARQFLGQMEKPDVDIIEGLSPAISIDQKAASRNPRSTVGTVTEIYDYLRVLFATLGVQHCHERVGASASGRPATDGRTHHAAGKGERLFALRAPRSCAQGGVQGSARRLRGRATLRVRVDGAIVDSMSS